MVVRSLVIDSVEPYGHGLDYEWVTGTAQLAADPSSPGNDRIVDLARAPREADGSVRFEADVRLLRPTSGGNRRLLLAVPNRGLLLGVPFTAGVEMFDLASAIPTPGDAFLLHRGWTIAWCGWQWDVLPSPTTVGLRAPDADVEPGSIRLEWRADQDQSDHPLSDSNPLFAFADYPTVDVSDPEAVLTVRTSPDGERTTIERSRWSFPDPTHVTVDGGFKAFHWYELVYRTGKTPVAGAGLLAIRDVASHLRRDLDYAFGYGPSQSGRVLRQLLSEGLNVDESGRKVFDGMFSHIAGGRLGEFNHRYAQPSLTHVIGFSNLPPYDTAGLVANQRRIGGMPKVFFTNSSWEYWRGDGALVHVDPVSGEDLAEDPDARTYLLAGTDHLGPMAYKDLMPAANPANQLDASLVVRALFVALERWVCEGIEPPPSQVPKRSEGTSALREDVLPRFPEAVTPDLDLINVTRAIDLGPDAEKGIGRWPLVAGEPMVAVVSAVDDDGNEVAGVRVPALAAPVGVFTGWNPRRPVDGLPGVLYEFLGSQLRFPSGRPTLTARYPDRKAYAGAARRAADDLATRGYLLADDVDRAVEEALALYDAALAAES